MPTCARSSCASPGPCSSIRLNPPTCAQPQRKKNSEIWLNSKPNNDLMTQAISLFEAEDKNKENTFSIFHKRQIFGSIMWGIYRPRCTQYKNQIKTKDCLKTFQQQSLFTFEVADFIAERLHSHTVPLNSMFAWDRVICLYLRCHWIHLRNQRSNTHALFFDNVYHTCLFERLH